MTSVSTSVGDLLDAGNEALNRGDPSGGLRQFSYASLLAVQGSDKAQAEQSAGICHRLIGNYVTAHAIFNVAFGYAEDDLHRGRIMRDWGMVYLDQGQADRAMELFDESMRLIRLDLERRPKEKARTEYFVTQGFIGRAYLMQGDTEAARLHMQSADLRLADYPPYELNNLVWLLKASPLKARWGLLPRGWRLAREAGHRQRQIQVVLTVLSPALARLIEARR